MLSYWTRAWLWLTCRSKVYKNKFFNGKYLSVQKAIDPSLILWENLGVSQKERLIRTLFTTLLGIILVCLVIAI